MHKHTIACHYISSENKIAEKLFLHDISIFCNNIFSFTEQLYLIFL